MRKPNKRAAGGNTVRGDTLLGRALAKRRILSEASPDYIALLDKLEASSGLGSLFEEALAGVGGEKIDEAACSLVHEVVLSALAASMTPGLPERRETGEEGFQELFAALKVLGRCFGVRNFPTLPKLPVGRELVGIDADAELHRVLEVYRAALENTAPGFEDVRSLDLLAALGYDLKEAPAALLKMWERLSILRSATFGSLTAPNLGRNRFKDAESRSFVVFLGRSMESLPAGSHLRFATAVTNILFDAEGDGGISDDAIRKRLTKSTR